MAKRYGYRKENDSNTLIIIGALLVLIVIVGAALVHIITQQAPEDERKPIPPFNKTNETNVTEKNITDVVPVCDDTCILKRALKDQNVSDCQNISNQTIAQECFEKLANISLDACKALGDKAKKKACISAFAVTGKNISLCNLLSEGIDECKLKVDPCYKATKPGLCRALAQSDPTECGSDSACLLNYSITKKDTLSCSLIQNPVIAAGCKYAVTGTDYCHDLSTVSERDYCYLTAAVSGNDFLVCTQVSESTVYSLDCYSIFAARIGNVSVCDKNAFSLNSKWACYSNYSLLSGDIEGCKQIDKLASTFQFLCGFNYAKKYGDPGACEVISLTSSKNTCYQGSIIYSNENLDWTNCPDVKNFEWRNKCFNEAAKLDNNVSLCEYITVEYAREACKIAYQVNQTS
jgi:hypothetical protein